MTARLDFSPSEARPEPLRLPAWNTAGHGEQIAAYVTGGLHAVEGWGLNPTLAGLFLAIDRFQKANGVGGNVFELGVHHGRAAILIALMAGPGETAVFLDLFERQDENIDFSGRGNREIFEHNLATWAPGCRWESIQANSLELDFASVAALAEGLRFAHIDGGHHREAVLNDLAKTQERLVEGGVIVMDDFSHSGFPEVNEACNYYLQQDETRRLAPVAIGANKLVLVTRGHHERLFAFLDGLGRANTPASRTVRFHGARAICLDEH